MKRELKENEQFIKNYIVKNAESNHSTSKKNIIYFFLLFLLTATVSIRIIINFIKNYNNKSIIVVILCLLISLFFLYISVVYIIRESKIFFKKHSRKKDIMNIKAFDTELIKVEKGINGFNDLGYVLDEHGKETIGIVVDCDYIKKNKNKCILVEDPVDKEIKYIFPKK